MSGKILHWRHRRVVPICCLHSTALWVWVLWMQKATGPSSWMSVAPSPLPDVSIWIVTGFFMLKYLSVVSSHTNDLSLSNVTWYVAFHLYSTSSFSNPLSIAVWEDSCGMNGERYVTIPRKLWNSPLVWGAGISFLGSGWAPCLSYTQPKNLTESFLTSHFFLLSTNPCSLTTLMNLCSCLSCSSSSLPCMMISSAIPMTPSHWLSIWSMIHLKISCAQASPNGRCTKWNLPLCVLKVVSRDDS